MGFDVSLHGLYFHWTEGIDKSIGWLFALYQLDGMLIHLSILR